MHPLEHLGLGLSLILSDTPVKTSCKSKDNHKNGTWAANTAFMAGMYCGELSSEAEMARMRALGFPAGSVRGGGCSASEKPAVSRTRSLFRKQSARDSAAASAGPFPGS